MILKKYIEDDLIRLNRWYSASISGPDPRVPIYCSKLAVLELSGWIEVSFDLIAKRAIKGRLKNQKFQKLLDTAIKNNHGFEYDNNFLSMLAKVVGLASCEQLHNHLDSTGRHAVLISEIDGILIQRNRASHVSLASTTTPFDSPSVTLARLSKLYPVLREIYRWFC